ncbi:YlmC/YmxH family sporulation protein [Brevibacillus panacihumi]|uniref:YlmC/YmxH family sporulation protein n=1 Tax=Brevibacillus panacihumi TaxID=497735 RepID=A0A3M8CNY7_9BACL|nr:YlmC/YmxH family sporulation protein [Brevibacillus panacihumi]RNB77378.1 YlmC/YmxH family sporulation protein [Brevibacillus panacihumi]
MRLSELGGKEIIGLDTGERMGVIGDSDLVIDPQNGAIESILLSGGGFLGLGKKREDIVIPWSSIIKIGPDMIIIQLKPLENQTVQK